MKKSVLFVSLALIAAFAAIPLHYALAEGDPAAAADKKPDAKKGGEGEGGGEKAEEGGKDKKKWPGDVTGGRFAGDPIYVRLAPLTLPILRDNEPEQLVTIQITVEVKDFDTADDMHEKMPKIMDALLQALYGGISQGSLRTGRVVDVGKIKVRAMSALQAVETGDHIQDVLIVNMSQRLL